MWKFGVIIDDMRTFVKVVCSQKRFQFAISATNKMREIMQVPVDLEVIHTINNYHENSHPWFENDTVINQIASLQGVHKWNPHNVTKCQHKTKSFFCYVGSCENGALKRQPFIKLIFN